jgi:hypothetical protein
VNEHQEVVDYYGLPAALPFGIERADLVKLMQRDKKAVDGLAFTLDGRGGAELVRDVPEGVVAAVRRSPCGSRGQFIPSDRELETRRHAGLLKDLTEVERHGMPGQEHLLRDLPVGQAAGDQLCDGVLGVC